MSCWKVPGRSGMRTVKRISVPAPRRDRSAMKRRREKFMFAPERTQAYVGRDFEPRRWDGGDDGGGTVCGSVEMYFLRPATANAPAGSRIERVSIIS